MSAITITADRLWDGTGTASLVRPLLRVRDGVIEDVQRGLLPPATCSGEVVDFPGCTILPGLIDTHVHLVFSAQATNAAIIEQVTGESDERLLERALANARAALMAGITTVRDCGGRGRIVQQARDRIRNGQAPGPDILSCGMPITTRRGHCHWLGLTAETLYEVQAAAEKMLAEDADFLKVMATGGNMTPSSDPMQAQFDVPALLLIADTARREDRHAAAHVLSRAGFPGAVQANFRTIEHCDMRVEEWRYEFSGELARRMVDQEQYAGLTMSGTARRAFLPEIRAANDGPVQRLDKRFECERRLIDSGVRITFHSDAGVRLTPIDRFDLGLRAAHLELKLTPAEVLQAVTRTAAEALRLEDRGTLIAQKRADLLVVEGNPLQDLESLSKVRAVMKEGVWLRREAVGCK